MSNILDELTGEQPQKELNNDQMGALGDAVDRLIAQQNTIAKAEEEIKRMKAVEREINQGEIPTMMTALGFEKITLKDGRSLAVKDNVQVAIPAPMRPAAYVWMDANNHGDLIKQSVTCKFARGEQKEARQAVIALEKIGIQASTSEGVHAGTLKAWARVELEQGHTLPADLFKVHVIKMTTVK
jgi:hypothetical protein